MALTNAQKYLIDGLMIWGLEKDLIVGIVCALKLPEQQDDMMEWMCENRDATAVDFLNKTVELIKLYGTEDEEYV